MRNESETNVKRIWTHNKEKVKIRNSGFRVGRIVEFRANSVPGALASTASRFARRPRIEMDLKGKPSLPRPYRRDEFSDIYDVSFLLRQRYVTRQNLHSLRGSAS